MRTYSLLVIIEIVVSILAVSAQEVWVQDEIANRCLTQPAGNRRSHAEVYARFMELLEEREFRGQEKAIDVVKQKFWHWLEATKTEKAGAHFQSSFLAMHFVGTTGVGKSLLAELIARSLFEPKDCQSSFFGMCSGEVDWKVMCGVVFAEFTNVKDDGVAVMNGALHRAAKMALHNPEGIVMILDDFKYCTGDCLKTLQRLLADKVLPSGRPVEKMLVILTSDLVEEGLVLDDGIFSQAEYDSAIEKVEKVAERHWEKDFLKEARLVPFAPLFNDHLRLIANDLISELRKTVNRSMQKKMNELAEKDNASRGMPSTWLYPSRYIWNGKFICQENTINSIMQIVEQSKGARFFTVNVRMRLQDIEANIEERYVKNTAPAAGSDQHTYVYLDDIELFVKDPGDALKYIHLEPKSLVCKSDGTCDA